MLCIHVHKITSVILLSLYFALSLQAYEISLSDSDFSNSPVFSSVTTFGFNIEVQEPLTTGFVADPAITNIQYSVSGNLTNTPSGFPAFAFQLDHIFPNSPPITGAEFYALDADAPAGTTIQFSISASADLSDGVQINELDVLPENVAVGIGTGVVFHFNGQEEGTGRYHPMFLQLRSDGTGILQNSNNFGGINPITTDLVDVDFGEEYITNLTFDPNSLTFAVPEPSSTALWASLITFGYLAIRSRRRKFRNVEI